VRVVLDEDVVSTQLIAGDDEDTLKLDELIASKIADAAQEIEMAAPTHLLTNEYSFAGGVKWNEDGKSGYVVLPEDFMRLVVMKMSDWERSVYQAISEGDGEYDVQFSRWAGLRGTPQKPVCAIVMRPEGLVLEFWSSKNSSATMSRALYLPVPTVKDGVIALCPRCYRAIVYETGALTMQALQKSDVAQVLSATAMGLIERGGGGES